MIRLFQQMKYCVFIINSSALFLIKSLLKHCLFEYWKFMFNKYSKNYVLLRQPFVTYGQISQKIIARGSKLLKMIIVMIIQLNYKAKI